MTHCSRGAPALLDRDWHYHRCLAAIEGAIRTPGRSPRNDSTRHFAPDQRNPERTHPSFYVSCVSLLLGAVNLEFPVKTWLLRQV